MPNFLQNKTYYKNETVTQVVTAGYTYKYTVTIVSWGDTVKKIAPRTASADVWIRVAAGPVPFVTIKKMAMAKPAPNKRVTLVGVVPVPIPPAVALPYNKIEWSCPELDMTQNSQFVTTINSQTLVVHSGILLPRQTYTFKLVASSGADEASATHGESWIKFTMNAGPSGGGLQVSPATGTSDTQFKATAVSWQDDDADLPLRYSFSAAVPGAVNAEKTAVPLGAVSEQSSLLFYLRAPDSVATKGKKTTVVLRAIDKYGAETVKSQQIQVTPPASSTAADVSSWINAVSIADLNDADGTTVFNRLDNLAATLNTISTSSAISNSSNTTSQTTKDTISAGTALRTSFLDAAVKAQATMAPSAATVVQGAAVAAAIAASPRELTSATQKNAMNFVSQLLEDSWMLTGVASSGGDAESRDSESLSAQMPHDIAGTLSNLFEAATQSVSGDTSAGGRSRRMLTTATENGTNGSNSSVPVPVPDPFLSDAVGRVVDTMKQLPAIALAGKLAGEPAIRIDTKFIKATLQRSGVASLGGAGVNVGVSAASSGMQVVFPDNVALTNGFALAGQTSNLTRGMATSALATTSVDVVVMMWAEPVYRNIVPDNDLQDRRVVTNTLSVDLLVAGTRGTELVFNFSDPKRQPAQRGIYLVFPFLKHTSFDGSALGQTITKGSQAERTFDKNQMEMQPVTRGQCHRSVRNRTSLSAQRHRDANHLDLEFTEYCPACYAFDFSTSLWKAGDLHLEKIHKSSARAYCRAVSLGVHSGLNTGTSALLLSPPERMLCTYLDPPPPLNVPFRIKCRAKYFACTNGSVNYSSIKHTSTGLPQNTTPRPPLAVPAPYPS